MRKINCQISTYPQTIVTYPQFYSHFDKHNVNISISVRLALKIHISTIPTTNTTILNKDKT
jgi:hypothetical protein